MSGTPVIEIERLRKFYKGKHRGIDGVDLEVYQGEIFGFLGPNGAGRLPRSAFTIFHYWNYRGIFVDGIVSWAHIALLITLSAVLFIAGAVVFERKDL